MISCGYMQNPIMNSKVAYNALLLELYSHMIGTPVIRQFNVAVLANNFGSVDCAVWKNFEMKMAM